MAFDFPLARFRCTSCEPGFREFPSRRGSLPPHADVDFLWGGGGKDYFFDQRNANGLYDSAYSSTIGFRSPRTNLVAYRGGVQDFSAALDGSINNNYPTS